MCDRFTSLNPIYLEELPAEKVFKMVGELLNYDKKNIKENKTNKQGNSKKITVNVLPSKKKEVK